MGSSLLYGSFQALGSALGVILLTIAIKSVGDIFLVKLQEWFPEEFSDADIGYSQIQRLLPPFPPLFIPKRENFH